MESHQIKQALSDQWKSAVRSSHTCLERDDLYQIVEHDSWDDLQARINESCGDEPTNSEFTMLAPSLLKLKTFAELWLLDVGSGVRPSPIWGHTNLLIKLLQEEKAAIPQVIPQIREVCNYLGILSGYFSQSETLTTEIIECCVESGIVLLKFLSDTIKFLRNNMPIRQTANIRYSSLEWQPLEERFQATLQRIKELTFRSEKLSKFARVDRSLPEGQKQRGSLSLPSRPVERQFTQASQSSQATDRPKPKHPCVILPSFRTSRFFDRTDVIAKMEKFFNQDDFNTSFRSLAIHGLGGVGKSTVALKYAERKLQQNELDVICWVYSEKLVSLKQSFTDIALRLKLSDARPGDHEENHALVLNWLQNTDKMLQIIHYAAPILLTSAIQSRWLIVYDNAEDVNMVRHYWPVASRGHAIITTRNPVFGFELADRGMEIIKWDSDTGLRFLLHLLSAEIGNELEEAEITSAQQLSQKLDGHALAISTMAGLIHNRAMTTTEFVTFYDQHPNEVHGLSGNRSINALWEMAFRSLSANSFAILSVLSFLEPDNIPQALFETQFPDDLPASLRFCSDSLGFNEAIENLLTISLIKRDKATKAFSLHRLVQTSFRTFMTAEQKQTAFNDAVILVAKAFPRRDTEVATLYMMWDRCATFLQHVISLKDCFKKEHTSNTNFTATALYCDLNNMCQRYLLELNSHEELEDLIEVNTLAMNTLPEEQQAVGLWGSLTSHRGQLLVFLGEPEEGVKWLKKSYDIRSKDVPFNPRESTWAAVNVAMGLATLNDFAEAITWHETARNHFMSWASEQTDRDWDLPADTTCFRGSVFFWAGRTKEAREILNKAMQLAEAEEPFSWAVAASVHFALGNLERHDRNYDTAEAHYMDAQNLWLKGDQMRSDPFNGSIMYRLGCTALDRGSVAAAIKHLRDAVVVTDMRKNKMAAEHARVLFKLSEALEQDPRSGGEARKKRDEAERLLRQRSPTADPGRESTYDNLICIEWR